MIVPNPTAVAQQCSSSKIPIFDPNIKNTVTTVLPTFNSKRNKQKKNFDKGENVRNQRKEILENNSKLSKTGKEISGKEVQRRKTSEFVIDDEQLEGSGNGNGMPVNKTMYGE